MCKLKKKTVQYSNTVGKLYHSIRWFKTIIAHMFMYMYCIYVAVNFWFQLIF